MQRFAQVTLLPVALVLALLSGCSSDAAPDQTPAPTPPSTNSPTVSDEVPSMDELREMGLSDEQAECFTKTIDPDGTGRVSSVDLFVKALGDCM